MTITLDEQLDDDSINDLKSLERDMYLQGDSRSDILRRVLDLLSTYEVIDDKFYSPIMKMSDFTTPNN